MKKFLAAMVIAGVLVVGMAGAARALLQDTEYVVGNKVVADTLNLKVGDNDPTSVSFLFNFVQPGEEREFSVPIASTGRMPGNFWFEVATSNSIEGDNPESETETTGEGELDDCAEIRVDFTNNENEQVALVTDWVPVNSAGTLETFWGNSVDAWVGNETGIFNLKLRTDACGSDSMGDGFDLDLIFHLDQV